MHGVEPKRKIAPGDIINSRLFTMWTSQEIKQWYRVVSPGLFVLSIQTHPRDPAAKIMSVMSRSKFGYVVTTDEYYTEEHFLNKSPPNACPRRHF